MWSYNYTNELYHHGIKGMKWGVRRYQNENGTLTPEGKKKYSEGYQYITKNGEKVNILVSKEKKIKGEKGTSLSTVHKAYVNGKKVTIAHLDNYGKEHNLNWISTKSKQQGKGYAQTMMNHLIKYSSNKKAKFMTLEVPNEDDNAIHIYEKYGFKNIGKTYEDFLIEMKKNLK